MAPFKKNNDKPTDKPESRSRKPIKHVAGAWILVPRPGRVYYFNTATGESVWKLNEATSSIGSSRDNKTRICIEPTSAVDEQLNDVNTNDSAPVNKTTPEVVNQPVIPPNAMYWPNANYPLFGLQMPNVMPPMISQNGLSNQMTSNMMPPVFSNGMSNQITSHIPPFGIPPSVYPQVFQPSLFQPPTVVREISQSISQKFKELQQGRLNQVKDNAKKKMTQYATNDLRIKLMTKKINEDTFPETEPVQPMEPEEPEEPEQLDNEIIETQEPLEEYVDEDGEQHAHESNYYQHFHRDIVSYADITANNATELDTATEDQREVIEERIDESSSDDQIIVLDLTPVFEMYNIKTDKLFYIFADTNVFMNNLNFLIMFVNSGQNCRLIISKHLLTELQMVAFNSIESHPNDQAARGLNHLTNKIRAGTAVFVEDLMSTILKYEIGCSTGDDFMLTACLWLKKAGEQYTFLTNDKVLISKSRVSTVNVVHINEVKQCIENQIIQIGTDGFIKRQDIQITTTIEQTREPTKHIQIDNKSQHSEETIKIADPEKQQHQKPTTVTRKTKSQAAILPEPQKKKVCQPQVNIHNTNKISKSEPKVNITPTNQQPANKPVQTANNHAVWGFTTKNKSKFIKSFKKNTRAMKILNKVELITSSPCRDKDDNNDVFLFEIIDGTMETNLKTRCEEWVSHYDQIMVDVLSQILQRNTECAKNIKPPPPWTITEATHCIKSIFSFDPEISRAATVFINLLMKHSDMRGTINKELTPQDFMKVFSYGVHLLDTMESVLTDIDDIEVAQRSLAQLLNNIKEGSESSLVVDIPSNGTSNANTNHTSNTRSSDAERYESTANNSPVISTDAGTQNESTVKIVRQVSLDFDFIKHLKNKSGNTFTNKKATKDSSNQMSDNNVDDIEVGDQLATDASVKTAPTILRKFKVCPKLEERLNGSCELSDFNGETSSSDMHDDDVYPDIVLPELDCNETDYDDTVNNDGNEAYYDDAVNNDSNETYYDDTVNNDGNETYYDDTVNNDADETYYDDAVNNDGNETHYDDAVNNDRNHTLFTDGETSEIQTDFDCNYTDCNNTNTVDDDDDFYDNGQYLQDNQQTNKTKSLQLTEHQQIVTEESLHSELSNVSKSDLGDGPKYVISRPVVREITNVFIKVRSFCTQVQLSDISLSSDPKKLYIKKQTEACEYTLKLLMEKIDGILERENLRAEKNASDNKKYREKLLICKQQGSMLLEALSYIASELK